MRPTPEAVAATYTWLLAFPPFNRWNLPPAKSITFYVVPYTSEHAEFDREKMTLRVSSAMVGKAETLVKVMAHELVHVREHVCNKWTAKHDSAFFKECRDMVTEEFFGFDKLIF